MSAQTNQAANENSFVNQAQVAWSKFSVSQKWGVGILAFVVFVLPLSLVVIRTQTNWFPKADHYVQPVTAPASPDPVTPPWSPTPSCLPIPSPSCYPSGTAGGGTVCSMPTAPSGYSYCPYPSPSPSISPNPRVSPPPSPGEGCMRAGCSGELCIDANSGSSGPISTICVYKPVFACYNNVKCEKQSTGQCGFTMTDEARACVQQYQPPKEFKGAAYFKNNTPTMLQLENGGTKNIGRYFMQLTSDFPATPTMNSDNTTISYFNSNLNATVTVRPFVTRAIPDVASSTVPFAVRILGVAEGRALIIPKDTEYFDKGLTYKISWDQISPNSSSAPFVTTFSTISTSGIVSDLNNDGKVDIRDYSVLSREFLKTKTQYDADLNGDRKVNLLDYNIFIRDFKNNN